MNIEYFKMIDEVVSVRHDLSTITCMAMVPTDAKVFEGHFPGNPLLPGALSIEVMAQAAGFLAMLNADLKKMGYLLALENARFRVPVRPGTTLTAFAQRTHLGSGYAAFRCALHASATQVASAELRIKLSEFENDVLRDAVLGRLAQLRLTERVAAAHAE